MNSILQSLQPSSVVAGVVQMLRSPKLCNKILVIVEGEDDKKLYSCFFREDTAYLYSLGGCLQMEAVLSGCNPVYELRYIILKDADFDHLNRIVYAYPNLFLTDTHDAETMMLNEDCMKKLCYEHLCLDFPSFESDIFRDLAPLSYIKWYSSANCLKINFDIIKISNLYNGTNPIDLSFCIQTIYSNAANVAKARIVEQDILEFMEAHADIDPLLLSNGHDICECIAIKLKSMGSGNVSRNEIPRSLRLMYSMELFKQTSMYEQIVNWEVNNNCEILKN
ncbi:DUF4435 domain-containing protein [Bacteroides sp.]